MTGRAAPRFAWALWRSRGLRFLVRRAWRRYAWGRDRLVVLVGPLARTAPVAERITFGPATAADLDALDSLSRRATWIRTLLAEGEGWLHVARDGERLVGYRFATRGIPGAGILARAVRLERHQAYVEDILVDPAYRRRDIGHGLVVSQNAHLLDLGFREFVAAVALENVASLRLTMLGGARPVLFVDSRRRLLVRRLTLSPALPAAVQRLADDLAAPRRGPDSGRG